MASSSVNINAPVLDPVAQTFLDALQAQGGTPIYKLPVAQARGVLTGAQAGVVSAPETQVTDYEIKVIEGVSTPIRIVKPHSATGVLPVVMYFHGGGWVLGDRATHDRLIREIAAGAQTAVVFVDYTRAPESPYPKPIDECYNAAKWVLANAASLGIDPARLAVAGDSAGGNIAAAVAILAKERADLPIIFQLLFYPVTDISNVDTLSYKQFAEGYFLTREAMKWFIDQYVPDSRKRTDATASPLLASIDELRGLPPTLIITAETDVLRDEGEAFARKLTIAGVPVTATRYLGIIHDFVMLNVVSQTPATRAAVEQACNALRKAFFRS